MSNKLTQFDHYLTGSGPAALVIREYLVPVEGPDGVLFPPTFAAGDGFPGGYNIDGDPNGDNIALVDSVEYKLLKDAGIVIGNGGQVRN